MDLSILPAAGASAMPGSGLGRWRPGLPCAVHNEIFASGNEASGAAFGLALALDGLGQGALGQRHLLWVQDRAAARLTGRPYRPGLPAAPPVTGSPRT